MAFAITESCIRCWACQPLCPSQAISVVATSFKIDAKTCTECVGEYEVPQCSSICPVEEAIVDSHGVPLNPLGSLTRIPAEKRQVKNNRMEITNNE